MRYIIVLAFAFLIFGCGSPGGSDSPSNAVKDFVVAVKEKNGSKAWTYLSAESQKLYENMAKNRNQSGKDYFEKSLSDTKSLGILNDDFNVVDEKIEGDAAVVFIKTSKGESTEMYTIKENGTWHLDYAKTIQKSMEQPE